MDIATIVFTYNRSAHIKKVLEALKENDRLPHKLFLFQDGLGDEQHRPEWEQVNFIIHSVDWCDCTVIVSDTNRGLADAITEGLNYVFKAYEAVIVLEDDCVTHPQFLSYMTEGLKRYRERKEIYSIGGYAWPVDAKENGTDAYFTQRISSWGWGTWKDRWRYYDRDYRMLSRIKKNSDLNERFHIWGEDLESYLLGNVMGNCNSWAVFWALTVIERGGYCLAPYESLVENIGFDGTGAHCGMVKPDSRLRAKEKRVGYQFPEQISIPKETENAFKRYFAWTSRETKLSCYNDILANWVGLLQNGWKIGEQLGKDGIKKVCIWGKGQLCDLFLDGVKDSVEVLAVIESRPREKHYKGLPIIRADRIPEDCQLIVVIPVYDMDYIMYQIDARFRERVTGIDELFGRLSISCTS